MAAGDINYEHSLWVQEGSLVASLTVGTSVSKGDILCPGFDVNNDDHAVYVALEDADEGDDLRVLMSGVVKVPAASDSVFVAGEAVTYFNGSLDDLGTNTGGGTASNAVVLEDVADADDEATIYLR